MRRRLFLQLLSACTCAAPFGALPALAQPSAPGKGMVTFTFDDGLASVYKYALPILRGHGHKATAALIASRVQEAENDDYMTLAQVRELEAAGWEIASHSLTHTRPIHIPKYYTQELISGWSVDGKNPKLYQTQYDYDLIAGIYQDGKALVEVEKLALLGQTPGAFYYDRPIAELHVHPLRASAPEDLDIRAGSYQRELDVSKQTLTQLGFKVSTYIAPYNYWPDDMKQTSKSYYSQAVTGKDADNRPGSFDPYAIRRFMMHERDSVASVLRLIRENAQEYGGWVIFCFHGIGDSVGWEPWAAEKLDAVAAYLAQQNIPVVTIEEGARIMRQMSVPRSGAGRVSVSSNKKGS